MKKWKARNINRLLPNQSLKLTEVAGEDLIRAKQPVPCWTGLARADWLRRCGIRRRSLAPVR